MDSKKRVRRDRVAEQTAIRTKMLANGYVPLANKDKMCTIKGWSKIEVNAAQIEAWSHTRFVATGVRLDGALAMIDWDIDDGKTIIAIIQRAIEKARNPEQARRFQDLYDKAPVRFGKGEKEAWFCRIAVGDEGFGRYASSAYAKPGEDPEAEGTVLHRLEVFNSSGRQAGVYGAHTLDAGEVVREYRWLDDVGLADIEVGDLVELTREDISDLCQAASEYMEGEGWVYHNASKSGATCDEKVYDLRAADGRVFDTEAGEVDLEGLLDLVSDGSTIRLSASWLEGPAARNRTRCIADLHPIDGRLSILDTATWQSHRPAEMGSDQKYAALREGMAKVGLIEQIEAARQAAYDAGEAPIFAEPADEGAGGIGSAGGKKTEIMVFSGYLDEAAAKTARLMARDPRFFDFGGEPAVVTGNRVEVMNESRLQFEVAQAFHYVKPGKKGGEDEAPPEPIKIDPPIGLVKQVISMGASRGLKPLRGVIDMPTIRPDGEIVSANGYDEGVELFLHMDKATRAAVRGLVERPTRADMASALETLWAPFREFPFVDGAARGGMLAALLTASIRPVLPTAPAFAFDAPSQGSGKTLLARCVGALAGRHKLMAPLPVRDEAEVAKVALSVLLDAPRAVIFDNQLGLVDSAALASVLTSPIYSGRILGSTRTVEMPTNMVVMLTGNNIMLGGDMPRRVVSVRIDAGVETPFTRRFDFDPLMMVERGRPKMICAALTLIRGAFAAVGDGRIGSFEHWDRLVAQTVAFVGGENGVGRGEFLDPTALLVAAHEADPTREVLTDLLSVLRDQFGTRWFGAKDVHSVIVGNGPGHKDLADAIDGAGLGNLSTRSIGRLLQNRRGQRVNGRSLEALVDGKHGNKYRVADDADAGGVVVEGRFAQAKAALKGSVDHIL